MAFAPGQRWISLAEPELGLGTVLRIEGRTVQLAFAATGTVRAYATHAAPLQRAQFRPGDRVSGDNRTFVVERVETHDGVLSYFGGGDALAEGQLDDVQDLSKADERLIAGRVDSAERFDFRATALQHRAQARRSLAWGLLSARIDLIPHQLRVAEVVVARRPVRVLLADEVGLGKTIEAGMILAQLLAGGRIERALIVLRKPWSTSGSSNCCDASTCNSPYSTKNAARQSSWPAMTATRSTTNNSSSSIWRSCATRRNAATRRSPPAGTS